jgi:hypothetical protein
MENQITMSPVIINTVGTTKVERQFSVVQVASTNALTACIDMKGKVGVAIRQASAQVGLGKVLNDCVNGNYRSLAEVIALKLGEPMVISGRATFEALPDIFEGKVMSIKNSKSGGMTTSKKTGITSIGAKLKLHLEIKAMVTEIVTEVAEIHAERKANVSAIA